MNKKPTDNVIVNGKTMTREEFEKIREELEKKNDTKFIEIATDVFMQRIRG